MSQSWCEGNDGTLRKTFEEYACSWSLTVPEAVNMHMYQGDAMSVVVLAIAFPDEVANLKALKDFLHEQWKDEEFVLNLEAMLTGLLDTTLDKLCEGLKKEYFIYLFEYKKERLKDSGADLKVLGAVDLATKFLDKVPFVNIASALVKAAKDLREQGEENSVAAKTLKELTDSKWLATYPEWYKNSFPPREALKEAAIFFRDALVFATEATGSEKLKKHRDAIKLGLDRLSEDFAAASSFRAAEENEKLQVIQQKVLARLDVMNMPDSPFKEAQKKALRANETKLLEKEVVMKEEIIVGLEVLQHLNSSQADALKNNISYEVVNEEDVEKTKEDLKSLETIGKDLRIKQMREIIAKTIVVDTAEAYKNASSDEYVEATVLAQASLSSNGHLDAAEHAKIMQEALKVVVKKSRGEGAYAILPSYEEECAKKDRKKLVESIEKELAEAEKELAQRPDSTKQEEIQAFRDKREKESRPELEKKVRGSESMQTSPLSTSTPFLTPLAMLVADEEGHRTAGRGPKDERGEGQATGRRACSPHRESKAGGGRKAAAALGQGGEGQKVKPTE